MENLKYSFNFIVILLVSFLFVCSCNEAKNDLEKRIIGSNKIIQAQSQRMEIKLEMEMRNDPQKVERFYKKALRIREICKGFIDYTTQLPKNDSKLNENSTKEKIVNDYKNIIDSISQIVNFPEGYVDTTIVNDTELNTQHHFTYQTILGLQNDISINEYKCLEYILINISAGCDWGIFPDIDVIVSKDAKDISDHVIIFKSGYYTQLSNTYMTVDDIKYKGNSIITNKYSTNREIIYDSVLATLKLSNLNPGEYIINGHMSNITSRRIFEKPFEKPFKVPK